MPLERDIVKKIKDHLELRGWIVMKYHGGPYSVVGHSDLYGVMPGGRAFFIEVKVPGKKPSPAQEAFLQRMKDNGAASFWVDNLEDVIKFIP